MRATAPLILLILLLAACADRDAAAPYVRGAPVLAQPDAAKKVAFLYALFTSGEQTDLGGRLIPTWYRIGQPALLTMGRPALDHLLAPERTKEYFTSPNILTNVLQLLPDNRGVRDHPRLQPFLLHWLDEKNCPPRMEGNDWVSLWRKSIFALFTHYPHEQQADACIAELDRKKRVHDLRSNAILVLLRIRRSEPLKERLDGLPQPLRNYLYARLHELAAEKMPAPDRAVARAFLPDLKESLDAPDAYERIYAAATMLRLDVSGMSELLIEEFARANGAGAEDAAWVAMRTLAQDKQDPRAQAICWRHAQGTTQTFSWLIANELLRKYWLTRPDVQEMLWARLEASDPRRPLELVAILQLLRVDRARVVRFLMQAILGDNRLWRRNALRFVRTNRSISEAGPWLIQLAQKTSIPGERATYYGALTVLRETAVLPLLRAELDDARDKSLRWAVATGLVAFGDPEGLDRIAELLKSGDRSLLDWIFDRAQRVQDGVPDAFADALLHVLKNESGEEARLKALFALRARGRLQGVEKGLIEAYRAEPSRRVAHQIETTLNELVHR